MNATVKCPNCRIDNPKERVLCCECLADLYRCNPETGEPELIKRSLWGDIIKNAIENNTVTQEDVVFVNKDGYVVDMSGNVTQRRLSKELLEENEKARFKHPDFYEQLDDMKREWEKIQDQNGALRKQVDNLIEVVDEV